MNPYSKEDKLFSIISPCYKEAYKCLAKNAKTLSEQEYKTFEWIVIFDGPHKKGVEEMRKIVEKYPDMDIRFFNLPEHQGACAARNYGAELASGEYLCFLNSDNYLYPEALRVWANVFDEKPHINRVWGLYDQLNHEGQALPNSDAVPKYPNGKVWYKAFKYQNYCDSTFPIRKSAYINWDNNVISLQDWDWAIRQLERNNFEGKDWHYIPHAFFASEPPREGGLSNDSHTHWIERTEFIKKKNGLPLSDTCVVSLGAAHHGFHIAEKLGADYMPMPSFKPNKYKTIYLVGFYTREQENSGIRVTGTHMGVFNNFKGKKIIHWIGSDVLQLRNNCSFEKIKILKKWFKDEKIIHLTEFKTTQDELKELGINSKIVPIPPKKLYDIMPLPKEFKVGIYLPDSGLYNEPLMMQIMRSMPDIKFVLFGNEGRKGQKGDNYEWIGYTDTNKLIKDLSCNLRITRHDGLPLLPLEFITAGRNVVTNVDIKHSIQVESDRKSIINGIRKAQDMGVNKKGHDYWTKELNYKLFASRIKGVK